MGNILNKLIGGGAAEVLREGTKLVDEAFTSQEEKQEAKKELYRMVVSDRAGAREMYRGDSWLQKVFAVVFLAGWLAMTALILQFFIYRVVSLEEWQIAFLSTVYGGMATKLGTVVDFLFGGSMPPNRPKKGRA